MILYIDTTRNDLIAIALKKGKEVVASHEFEAKRRQAEKLLPAIDGLLKENKLKLADIKEINVENKGGSFTSLRIGVVTANALGFALGVPVVGNGGKQGKREKRGKREKQGKKFDIVEAEYNAEASVGL